MTMVMLLVMGMIRTGMVVMTVMVGIELKEKERKRHDLPPKAGPVELGLDAWYPNLSMISAVSEEQGAHSQAVPVSPLAAAGLQTGTSS